MTGGSTVIGLPDLRAEPDALREAAQFSFLRGGAGKVKRRVTVVRLIPNRRAMPDLEIPASNS